MGRIEGRRGLPRRGANVVEFRQEQKMGGNCAFKVHGRSSWSNTKCTERVNTHGRMRYTTSSGQATFLLQLLEGTWERWRSPCEHVPPA